jgi:hypothetical protein
MLMNRYRWSLTEVERLTADDIWFWDSVAAAGDRAMKRR